MGFRNNRQAARLRRRRVLLGLVAALAAVPAARVTILRSRDNPLPQVASPDLVLSGGWLLDSADAGGGGGG